MLDHLLELYHQYDSNKWSNMEFGEEITQVMSIQVTCIRELAPPPGAHVFLDIIMNFRNLQKGHQKTIYAKYHSNLASGFREEDF